MAKDQQTPGEHEVVATVIQTKNQDVEGKGKNSEGEREPKAAPQAQAQSAEEVVESLRVEMSGGLGVWGIGGGACGGGEV